MPADTTLLTLSNMLYENKFHSDNKNNRYNHLSEAVREFNELTNNNITTTEANMLIELITKGNK